MPVSNVLLGPSGKCSIVCWDTTDHSGLRWKNKTTKSRDLSVTHIPAIKKDTTSPPLPPGPLWKAPDPAATPDCHLKPVCVEAAAAAGQEFRLSTSLEKEMPGSLDSSLRVEEAGSEDDAASSGVFTFRVKEEVIVSNPSGVVV